jgi:pimeloyl-ACP methyl ester carboxylesterase
MFPLFFGPEDEALYGVCHEPEPDRARPLGAVLCQPILHESAEARRALRALGDQLAATGIHVLRFDYFGTGNSAGVADVCTVDRWTRDIGLAIEELKASRGLAAVGLVGLRLGASLAARVASQRKDLPFLVLWEPVVRGALYVDSLRGLQAAWLEHESRERPGARELATAEEVVGFPFSRSLRDGLAGINLREDALPHAERTLIVDEGEGGGLGVLETRLRAGGRVVEQRQIDGGQVWRRAFDAEHSQVPRELLVEVASWVAGEAGNP